MFWFSLALGGYGYDFSTDVNLEEGIEKVAHGILSQGVTSFCPTIITSPPDFYHKVCMPTFVFLNIS